jgi:hypothetical protein
VKVRDDEQAPVVNGQAAVNVTASGTITPIRLGSQGERGKTYVFRLRATQVYEEAALQEKTRPRRKATVVIPLPRRSALVLEIEAPSRDVIAFGVFLASLQVADGVLTSVGVSTWGLHAEGNPVLRTLMHYVGPHNAIVIAKCFAIVAVVFLTNVARKKKLFRDLIGAMTCLYLFAAIIPWVYFLSKHFSH